MTSIWIDQAKLDKLEIVNSCAEEDGLLIRRNITTIYYMHPHAQIYAKSSFSRSHLRNCIFLWMHPVSSHTVTGATLCSRLETWSLNHTKCLYNCAICNDKIRSLYKSAWSYYYGLMSIFSI